MTNQIPVYKTRNLSESCKDCPDNRQYICHCFDECIHPIAILYEYEHKRYQEAADKKENTIIHARWIFDESRFMAVCSHCMGNPTEGTGYGLDISTLDEKYHYCRLCGAKMDEEAADGNNSRV